MKPEQKETAVEVKRRVQTHRAYLKKRGWNIKNKMIEPREISAEDYQTRNAVNYLIKRGGYILQPKLF